MTRDWNSDLARLPAEPTIERAVHRGHDPESDAPANPYAHFPTAVVEYDADGGFVACSPAHRELFAPCASFLRPGMKRCEIVRAYAATFKDSQSWLEARLSTIQAPQHCTDIKLPDSRTIRMTEGQTPGGGVLCTSIDITDLQQDGNPAARRADQADYFADSASDWLWETDAELRFTYMSPNVERILDAAPEWHYGKTQEDLLGEVSDRKGWSRHLQERRDRKPFHNFSNYRVGGGVQPKWLSISGFPVFDEAGKFTGYRGIGRDITAEKEAELALQCSEAELQEIRASLEQRVSERTRKLDALNAALRQENMERKRIEQSLRESEARFHDFAKSTSDWFWETDADHCFKSFLDPQDMLQKGTREQYLGQTRLEAVNAAPGDEQWQRHWDDLNAHRPFRDFQYRINHDGAERYWSINGYPVFDKQGRFSGYRGTGSDITEQVRLEHQVSEQSRLLGDILDRLPVHVAQFDSNGRYVFINKYGAEKMGRAAQDFKGKIDDELFGATDAVNFSAMAMDTMKSGQAVVNETVQPAQWDDREALLNIVPMPDSGGRVSGALVVAQDVTDLSRAQAAIRENEALLKAIFEHLPAFLTMRRASDGVFQMTNERYNRIIGVSKDDIIGMKSTDVHKSPQNTKIIADHERRMFESRKAITEDRVTVGTDEKTRMSVTKFPVFDDDGNIVSIGTVAIDITEQRRVEEQLRQSQKMEVVGQLTGGVAHDFNNLLGVVIGNLDFLEERLRGQDDLHQMVTAATNAAVHGGELTRQLLAFSRRQPLAPRNIDLNLQITQMRDLLRRTLGETVDINLVTDPALWQCEADPTQVEAAVLNLAINARDSMPEGGSLKLSTANVRLDSAFAATEQELEAGEYVVLTVTDTGIGMPQDVLDKAFEPFFTTKKVGEGSGLGLSMVFGFAKQSRGHVAIESQNGHGTTVKLYLPRASESKAAPAAGNRNELPQGTGETILVVEDDPDLRQLAVAQLKHLGYNIVSAANGKAALELMADTGRIDLLLTDVILPGGMDGITLAREMTRRQSGLRVLYMSGYSEHSTFRDNIGEEVALLQKPFRKTVLARKIRDVLMQQQSS